MSDRAKPASRAILLTIRYILIALLVAYGPIFFVSAGCIPGLGFWTIPGAELLIFPLLVMATGIGALCYLPFPRYRGNAARVVAASLVVTAGFFPALYGARQLRMIGFYLASKRAEPLVDAIARYDRDQGVPPLKLNDLVPIYLPRLPSRLPPFEIVTGEEARRDFYGNRWALVANVSTGLLNWDIFIFFPSGNYPEADYGGVLERIGSWAYVHE